MMAGHEKLTSMGKDIHAYAGFARVGHISHGCMGLYSSRIFIHMHGCNLLGWHMSKLINIYIYIFIVPSMRTLAYQTCKLQDLELEYGESKTLSKVLTPNVIQDHIVVSSLGYCHLRAHLEVLLEKRVLFWGSVQCLLYIGVMKRGPYYLWFCVAFMANPPSW